jgi:hypothetical protein
MPRLKNLRLKQRVVLSRYEHADVKRKLGAQSRLEEQRRGRENEAAQALSTEQGRWVDLNARLEELGKLLGPIPRWSIDVDAGLT